MPPDAVRRCRSLPPPESLQRPHFPPREEVARFGRPRGSAASQQDRVGAIIRLSGQSKLSTENPKSPGHPLRPVIAFQAEWAGVTQEAASPLDVDNASAGGIALRKRCALSFEVAARTGT